MQLSNDKVQDIRGILPGLNLLEEIFWWHLNQWYKSVADQAAVLNNSSVISPQYNAQY